MAELIEKFAKLRQKASEVLPRDAFAYIDDGAGDDCTLEENRRSWRRIKLVPRCLKMVTDPDIECTLFGETLAAPLIVAPMAQHGLVHPEGECATARVAEKCGIPLAVSMFGTKDVGDIAQSGSHPVLLQQMYLLRDRKFVQEFLQTTFKNGCRYIVFTIDAPVPGVRKESLLASHPSQNERKLALSKYASATENFGPTSEKMFIFTNLVVDCDWTIVKWIKEIVDVKVIVKGLLSPIDAELAIEHGVDGIVVSNHGGRQLDTAVTPLDVLHSIARVVNNRVPVIVDGGVQRGTDIVKAMALGASAVMIGRPILFALAAGGEAAMERVINDLKIELKKALFLLGLNSVDQITSSILFQAPSKL